MEFKFDRNYVLTIKNMKTGDTKVIGMPFTIRFSAFRTFGHAQNFGRIQVYNLNQDSRAFIRKDVNDFGFTHIAVLQAGYGSELSTIIKGSVTLAYSERQGVDYVTSIDISDIAMASRNSEVSISAKEGTSQRSIIESLAKSLAPHGVEVGKITRTINQRTFRGASYSGNAIDIIDELTGGSFFIDNGVLNVLADDEYIKGYQLNVGSSTGLIGKPRIDGINVVFSMIFEPRAYLGQKVKINIGDKVFDGDYVIRSLTHQGTISDAVGEPLTTEITCTAGKYAVGV